MKYLHYALFSALFLAPGTVHANDKVFPCNPAKQNWVNGSKLACPFNSARETVLANGEQVIEVDIAPPPETVAPPDEDPK
jgi:hypothetical protein